MSSQIMGSDMSQCGEINHMSNNKQGEQIIMNEVTAKRMDHNRTTHEDAGGQAGSIY